MHHTFPATEPLDLDARLRNGDLRVSTTDTGAATVGIETSDGLDPADVEVELTGSSLRIRVPRAYPGLFGPEPRVDVTVTVPSGSRLRGSAGSGDILVDGEFGPSRLQTGSGDVVLTSVAATTRVDSGSGDLRVTRVVADLSVKLGSGAVTIDESRAPLALRAGSGDISVGAAYADVSATTGSGDITVRAASRGDLWLRTGSGNARIGVPVGVPVWTDVRSLGGVSSVLSPRGPAAQGQDHVRVHAQLGSGALLLEDA